MKEKPTFGIITALPEEFAAVEVLLENVEVAPASNEKRQRVYKLGEIPSQGGKHIVVLALLEHMGTNMASITASHLLNDYPTIQDIFMVGIAGGVPHPYKPNEHVRLGDVAVSNEYGIIQYDFVKETPQERQARPFPRPPSPGLLHAVKLLEAAELRGISPWNTFINQATTQLKIRRPSAKTDILTSPTNSDIIIPHPKDKKRKQNQPRIFVGPIAASNTLLKNPIMRDKLRDQFGVKAIEMESSGIADATWNNNTGYLAIRGICDYCDLNKNDDWHPYAAVAAAAYLRALLATVPPHEISSYQNIPLPLTNTDIITEAQQKFAELPTDTIPLPAVLPLGSRMPFSPNPHFVGREADLKALATALKGGKMAIISQVETAAMTGIGGIGKTQLASEFVHRYGQYFVGGVFWLSFANSDVVRTEIAACDNMIELEKYSDFRGLSLDDKVHLVTSAWQSSIPRLLVFDNCEDEQLFTKWRPHTGNCRILITSLRQNWSSELGIRTLFLASLSREESILLLCKYRNDLSADDPDLNAIADELGDLPLALHLAGKFLERYRHSNYGIPGIYLAKLRQESPLQHSSLRDENPNSATNHIQHVERTFAIAYEQLENEDSTDQEALRLLARVVYFAPSVPIPRDLLRKTILVTTDDLDMELVAEGALERLISLGLLESLENGELRLHRLIAEFIKIRIGTTSEAKKDVEQVILAAALHLNLVHLPQLMFTLHPHLRFAADQAKQRNDAIAAQLCNAEGYFLIREGVYHEARTYLEYALEILEQEPVQDQSGYVILLTNLAQVYEIHGDIQQAKNMVQQALKICEQTLGPDHLLLTDCLIVLAKLHLNKGELNEAKKLAERALEIRRRLLEPDHPDIAITLNRLAKVQRALKLFDAAESSFQQALVILKKNFRENHPDIAESLSDLAGLYLEQHKDNQAEQFYKDALKIQEEMLGTNHFNLAFTLNGLAVCYDAQHKYAEAQPLYLRALTLLEENIGTKNEFVVKVLANLANNYFKQKQYDISSVLLSKYVDSLGELVPEYYTIAQALEYLANIYNLQKEYVQAISILKRALILYEQIKGPAHIATVRSSSLLKEMKNKIKF